MLYGVAQRRHGHVALSQDQGAGLGTTQCAHPVDLDADPALAVVLRLLAEAQDQRLGCTYCLKCAKAPRLWSGRFSFS